jgi:hypothetical protein
LFSLPASVIGKNWSVIPSPVPATRLVFRGENLVPAAIAGVLTPVSIVLLPTGLKGVPGLIAGVSTLIGLPSFPITKCGLVLLDTTVHL